MDDLQERACRFGATGQRDARGRCRCEACRRAERERKAKWSAENRDRANAHAAKWRASNPEKYAESVAAWRKKNPDKAKAITLKAGAKWSKKRSDKRAAIRAKARAATVGRVASWADLHAIEAFYSEAARLTRETGVAHEVDHVIPLKGETVSGLHVETNLQIITRSQNRAKGSRHHDAKP